MVKYCECGCGGTTKSRFVPGHDAKMKSRLLNAMRAGDETAMDELINRGWLKTEGTSGTGSSGGFHYVPIIDLPEEIGQTDANKEMLDRVTKILALKANAGTEEEAQAAAAMAQKIAFKYNLDLAAIEQDRIGLGQNGTKNIIQGRMDVEANDWRRDLMTYITRSNFCRTVGLGTGRIAMIGERHNLMICDYLWQFLRREIDRLADAGWTKNKHVAWTSAHKWKADFRSGAVDGVATVLQRQRKQDIEETNSSALVILSDKDVENAMNKFFPNLVYGQSKVKHYGEGYNHGQEAGKAIKIHHGVERGAAAPAGRLRG